MRVAQTTTKTMAGTMRNLSETNRRPAMSAADDDVVRSRGDALEPKMRAGVMVANCIWYKAKAMDGTAGAVSAIARASTLLNPAWSKLPMKKEPVSLNAKLNPTASH